MNSRSDQQCRRRRIERLKEGTSHASGLCMHSKPATQRMLLTIIMLLKSQAEIINKKMWRLTSELFNISRTLVQWAPSVANACNT